MFKDVKTTELAVLYNATDSLLKKCFDEAIAMKEEYNTKNANPFDIVAPERAKPLMDGYAEKMKEYHELAEVKNNIERELKTRLLHLS